MSPVAICVCGAGTMGSGIAQLCATHGLRTLLYDVSNDALNDGIKKIREGAAHLIRKKKIRNEAQVLDNIKTTADVDTCQAEFIIEAVSENMEIKLSLLRRIASVNSAKSILATNTSSLSVTSIADNLPNPERVIGMHFFNPPAIMKLVEVVVTRYTSDWTIGKTEELAQKLEKTPVKCSDTPGFIVNRVARHYYLESLRLVEAGMATPELVDQLMEASGFRMGPFRLMDLIGNDINYEVSKSVYDQLGQPLRLKPSSLQGETVKAGHLGRKTGKGYYEY